MGIETARPSPRRAGARNGATRLSLAGPAAPEPPLVLLLFKFPLPAVSFADLGLSGTVCEMGKRKTEPRTWHRHWLPEAEPGAAPGSALSTFQVFISEIIPVGGGCPPGLGSRLRRFLAAWLWARDFTSQSSGVQSWKTDIRAVPTISSVLL